jgi:hypothetical protein
MAGKCYDSYMKQVYWELLNHDHDTIRESYASDYRDVYDLAILSWNSFISLNYFSSFNQESAVFLIYKTQVDIALKQAVSSVLLKQYPQALFNIRYAQENMVIAIFAYGCASDAISIIDKSTSMDEKMKLAANTYLAGFLPERSERLKGLKDMCNKYGTHQSIGHTGRNFQSTENGFNVLFKGADSPELNVGIAGIVAGMILEFHFAISEIGVVDSLKVEPSAQKNMNTIYSKLEFIKNKYRYLYTLI